MRRLLLLVSFVVVTLTGLATVVGSPAIGAQEGTPAVELVTEGTPVVLFEGTPVTDVVAEGLEVEMLSAGPVPALPLEPAEFVLFRARFAPGGWAASSATDLSTGLSASLPDRRMMPVASANSENTPMVARSASSTRI